MNSLPLILKSNYFDCCYLEQLKQISANLHYNYYKNHQSENHISRGAASNIQDLIGVKGRSVESALQNRGYKHINTTKSGSNAYSNWWHHTAKKCVTIRINKGRVKSSVYAILADCNKNK